MRSIHSGRKGRLLPILILILYCTAVLPVKAATPELSVPASYGVVLMEATAGQTLRESNAETTMASYGAVNLLIALTAVRHASLDDSVTVHSGIDEDIPDEAYVIYLEEGEILTVRDCIAALLFNSANDAAYTLAVSLAGSVSAYAQWMNEVASACGATNSHFTTVFDLASEEQYTTAKDMAYVAAAFWQEESLQELLCSDLYAISPTNITSETRYYANPFRMLAMGTSNYYEYALGGKASQNTVIAFAESNGMTLISVILGALNSSEAYSTAEEVLEYGFDYFQPVTIDYPGNSVARIPVYDGEDKIGYVDALVEGTFCYYAEVLSRKPTDPEGLASFFSHELLLPASLEAPVEAGEVIGRVVYTKLDDPHVQISLDCTAGSDLIPIEDSQKEQDAAANGWVRYLEWINWILIPLILYLAWRLIWPYLEKKIHKPKSF